MPNDTKAVVLGNLMNAAEKRRFLGESMKVSICILLFGAAKLSLQRTDQIRQFKTDRLNKMRGISRMQSRTWIERRDFLD